MFNQLGLTPRFCCAQNVGFCYKILVYFGLFLVAIVVICYSAVGSAMWTLFPIGLVELIAVRFARVLRGIESPPLFLELTTHTHQNPPRPALSHALS